MLNSFCASCHGVADPDPEIYSDENMIYLFICENCQKTYNKDHLSYCMKYAKKFVLDWKARIKEKNIL